MPKPSGSEPGASRTRRAALWASGALILLNLVVYAQVRHHPFINFDDPQYVSENRHVLNGLTREGIVWAFTTPHAGNWHPLTWISHMVDVEVFGRDAGGHHLVSAGIHLLNSLLLFGLLLRMTGESGPSAFVAALFAMHPAHVESVAWVAERKDVLSACFWLLTTWAYARYAAAPSAARYGLVVLGLAAGLMAKPMLVTLPFALLLLDYWPLGRFPTAGARRLVVEKLPLMALALASSVVTFTVQQAAGAVRGLDALPLGRRIGSALVGYVEYIWKTVWPADLALLYPHWASLPAGMVAGAAILLLGLTAAALFWGRAQPYLPVGWFWFVGTLMPVIGLVQVGAQRIADRYTYIPSIGLFLIAAWGAASLARRWRIAPRALTAGAAIVVLALTLAAHRQAGLWRSSVAVWEHTLRVTGPNAHAHNHLGHALVAEGRTADAITQYLEALRLHPEYAEALNNLGVAFTRTGRDDLAIERYRQAIRANDRLPSAHANLGAALASQGRHAEAVAALERALELSPDSTQARTNLAVILARSGRMAEAREAFDAIVRLEPWNADARRHLGAALATEGRHDDAIGHYREALRLRPGDPVTHNALGAALGMAGRDAEALPHYQEAVRIDPTLVEARNNLADALIRLGRPGEAVTHLQRSLELDPRQPDVRYELTLILLEQNRLLDAVDQLEQLLTDDPQHADGRALLVQLAARVRR